MRPVDPTRISSIYALVDPRFKTIRYVGITVQPLYIRLRKHLRDSELGQNTYRCRWVRQLLSLGLAPALILLEETTDRDREKLWIAFYKECGARLTNCTDGGEGLSNASEETRQKISVATKGKPKSEITRQRMKAHQNTEAAKELRRKQMIGRAIPPITEEGRRRISEAMKGKRPSEETRRKLSLSHTGLKQSPETIAKRKESNKGFRHTEETKKILSQKHLGMKHSEEARKKMSETRLRLAKERREARLSTEESKTRTHA